MGQLNCIACHVASDAQATWVLAKVGPRLTDVGGRASPAWIARYLASPSQTMPGTTMPDVLGGMNAAEKATAAEALTHYLVSQKPATFKRVLPDRAAVARGEGLYHRLGCVACHAPQKEGSPKIASAPLPKMAEKWPFDGLRRFLLDPLASRPSGRMPAMRLTDGEASDIAHYLLRETRVPAAVELAAYRGKIRSLEDVEGAELARTGPVAAFLVDPKVWERANALRFSSWLRVEQGGDYTFYFSASGASRLAIDGKWLAGKESWESERVDEKVSLHLEAGLHAVKVDYVHRGPKPAMMKLDWEGPGVERAALPEARLQIEREAVQAPAEFVVDAKKADAGRVIYEKLNCAACHDGKAAGKALPALSALDGLRGCLADVVPAAVPDFHLDAGRRNALRVAIKALNGAELGAPTARERVADAMASFKCFSCHARDGAGGVTEDRDRFFTSTSDDLGDEGRIPPKLDGVGDKLLPAWLETVLVKGGSVRPYYDTRMPQFGKENVGHLPELFVALDRKAEKLVVVADEANAQRDAGRKMVGTDGLSCIVCHRFNDQPAQTLQVIDLATAPARLNEDWFRRFLREPAKFHPGTRMPEFWPEGTSLLPTVLEGDVTRQLAAIWTYLADGSRAKFPEGVGRQNVELLAGGEAIVYRGKLWEAGFRAVAVGYPELVNAAFDAEEVRLSLLWQGRFLNAGPHWTIQGMGSIRPLGKDVAVFPHGPELAVLSDEKSAWPKVAGREGGLRFKGYQLDGLKRPTLLYSVGDVEVEDFMSGSGEAGKATIKRTIALKGAPAGVLYFRIGAGKIVASGKNAWRFNDVITLRVAQGEKAILRTSGDVQELILPVSFDGNGGRIEVEYAW